jgi:K+-sensing histidine kinase KdpD
LIAVALQQSDLEQLVSNLLEAARVEASALCPSLVRVPVEELCRAAVDKRTPR